MLWELICENMICNGAFLKIHDHVVLYNYAVTFATAVVHT